MIRIENTETAGWIAAIRGARNPMNSWNMGDTSYGTGETNVVIGPRDLALLRRLANAGPDHGKFLRMITVTVDVTAPLYWYKEFDTYKVGTVANSCSTMHRLTHKKFELSDFSFEHLMGKPDREYFDVDCDFKEKWVTVPGHPNYEVSNKGRVINRRRNKALTLSVNSSGYKKVVLDGKNLYVHRLVAESFCPHRGDAVEVNHLDGNKWNNNFTNLEWVTKSENAQHAFDMGLRKIGGYTRHKVSDAARRFSEDEVQTIREMYACGHSKQEIADTMGCYSSTICNILNGETYREVEFTPYDVAKLLVDTLNELRAAYLTNPNKQTWWQLIQLLPSSYNQRRTVHLNYAVLRSMYHARKNHKLDEWRDFCRWIESLPYAAELITNQEATMDHD